MCLLFIGKSAAFEMDGRSSLLFYSFHTISSSIYSGGGKKGVAIRPYPSPGPS